MRRWPSRVNNGLSKAVCLLLLVSSRGVEARAQDSSATAVRPPWNLPPDRFVSVDGNRLHYFDKGTGPAIVLLHGFSGSAGLEWGRVIDALAERHRVIAPHQLGFAPSEVPAIDYDTDALIESVAGLIRALELRDVTLVGESFGGWVAVSYAARQAKAGSTLPAIERLVLVDAAVGLTALEPGRRAFADPAAQAEAAAFVREHPIPDHELTRQRVIRNSGFLKGEPTAVELAAIEVPTLIVWGGEDELVPRSFGDRLAHLIPGARFALVPGGHIPPVERPRELIALLLDFAH